MLESTPEAPWELIKLGPIAVPAIAEAIREGTNPKLSGYERLIRAYIDHWSEVPKPIDARVLDEVRASMAASKVKGSRTEYHENLLKLAEKKYCSKKGGSTRRGAGSRLLGGQGPLQRATCRATPGTT